MAQAGADAVGHHIHRFQAAALDVDDAGAEDLVAAVLLPQLDLIHVAIGEFDMQHIDVEVLEMGSEDGKAAVRRCRPAAEVAETQVEADGCLDTLDAGVEDLHHLLWAAVGDPVGWLVELDVGAARCHDVLQLLVDERHQRPGYLGLVFVDRAGIDAKRLRHRALNGRDQRLVGQRAGIAELLCVAVAVRHGQRRDCTERVELVGAGIAEPAGKLLRFQPVDLAVEVPGEVGALHLAV